MASGLEVRGARLAPLSFVFQYRRSAGNSYSGRLFQSAAERLHKGQELLRRVEASVAHQQVLFHWLDITIRYNPNRYRSKISSVGCCLIDSIC
jgi:hypothetical protein